MGVLWDGALIAIRGDLSLVGAAFQVLNVIAHRQYQLVGDQFLVYQIQRQLIRHLTHYQAGLVIAVRTLQNLAGTDALGHRLVRLAPNPRRGL